MENDIKEKILKHIQEKQAEIKERTGKGGKFSSIVAKYQTLVNLEKWIKENV